MTDNMIDNKAARMEEAKEIVRLLALAFGGYSQVPNSVVGVAIFGRANNSPQPWDEDRTNYTIADCATVIDLHFDLEPGETVNAIHAGYQAAWKKAEGTHAPEL
jgi:hypothetical protein